MIGFVLVSFQVDVFRQNNFVYNSLQGEQGARDALKRLVTELRQVASSDNGAYPIALADKDRITFYSDINNNGTRERLRYFLSGTTFKRGVLQPTGSPLAYVESNEVVSDIVTNVMNVDGQVFSFYDENYVGTGNPLTLPVNLPDVRLIRISLLVEADPNRSPAPILYESQVSLRTLKDNL